MSRSIEKKIDELLNSLGKDPGSVKNLSPAELIRMIKHSERSGYRLPEILYYASLEFNRKGDMLSALSYIERVIEMLTPGNDQRLLADALSHYGFIQTNLGKYEEALDALDKARTFMAKSKNKKPLGFLYLRMGNVYRNFLQSTDKAITAYGKALKIGNTTGDNYIIASAYGSLGNAFLYSRSYEDAVKHYTNAAIMFETLGAHRHQCTALLGLGTAYRRLGKFSSAIEVLLIGIKAAKQIEDKGLLTSLSLNLALNYLQNGEHEKYKKFYSRSVKMINEIGDKNLKSNFYKGFSEVYALKGDFKSAFEHFEKYFELYSEIFREEAERLNKITRLKYEKDKADREKEIYKLKTHELAREIEAKTKELSAMASYLSQKNEFVKNLVRTVKSNLLGMKFEEHIQNYVNSAVRKAESASNMNEDLKRFESELERFSFDFIERLSKKFPALSRVELKICSMIKINLSTKEIANLLYLSHRTVENHKYRISKKIRVKSDQNITAFLNTI